MGCADALPRTIWWGTDENDGRAGVYLVEAVTVNGYHTVKHIVKQ